MFIQTETTPNPKAVKFLLPIEISPQKILSYLRDDSYCDSPLVKKLFEIADIKEILLGSDFITIIIFHEDWHKVKHEILIKITDYFNATNMIFEKDHKSDQIEDHNIPSEENEIIAQIKEIIEERVKPSVADHGGIINFVSFVDGVVWLELKGSCSGCPSSVITLKNGIENMLKHYVPEVESVESID